MVSSLPLSQLISYEKGKPPRSADKPFSARLPVLTPEYLRRNVASEYATVTKNTVVVEDGELILLWDGSNAGEFFSGKKGVLASTMVVLRFDDSLLDRRYLYHALKSFESVLKTQTRGSGIPHVDKDVLLEHQIWIPDKETQTAIGDVLSTVDRAIEQTEALIAKYRRIKAGLVHDLLTRGIDEDGNLRDPATHEFKESPLGLVPAEWEVTPLHSCAEIGSGVTLGRTLTGSDVVELPYLRVANVQDGYVDLSEVKTVRVYRHEISRFLLQAGDVLMNEGGDYDKLGRGTVWRGQIDPCLHQNHVFRVRVDRNQLLPEFLALVSASPYGKRFFVLSSKQSTNLASINSTQLKAFPIPLPSIAEQKVIVNVVNAHEAVIENESMQLTKLRHLKTGLMQDLLTGRVSVEPLLMNREQPLLRDGFPAANGGE